VIGYERGVEDPDRVDPRRGDARRVHDGRRLPTVGSEPIAIAARYGDTRSAHQGPHIAHGVSSFVSGWNSGNSAVLKEALARTAYLTMSTPRQGASAPDTGTSVTSIGWHQILPFAQRQHEAGQRLSYERIRVVRKRGAYGVGMRAKLSGRL